LGASNGDFASDECENCWFVNEFGIFMGLVIGFTVVAVVVVVVDDECIGDVWLVAGVVERSKLSISLSSRRKSVFCSLLAALSNSSSFILSKPNADKDEPIKFLTSFGNVW